MKLNELFAVKPSYLKIINIAVHSGDYYASRCASLYPSPKGFIFWPFPPPPGRFFPPIEKQGRIWRRTKKTEESDLLSAIVMELTHLLPLSLTLSLTHHLNNLMKWKIPLIMHIIMNAFFHFLFKLFKKNFKMWILRKILKNSGGPLRTLYNHF